MTPPPRPRSNVSKGAYYKGRAKKYLQAQGYQVADMEVVRVVYPPGRKPFPTKRDQFGADLLAVNGDEVIFVQVKGGRTARTGISKARQEFERFDFPDYAKRWIMVWGYRAREPEIIEVTGVTG